MLTRQKDMDNKWENTVSVRIDLIMSVFNWFSYIKLKLWCSWIFSIPFVMAHQAPRHTGLTVPAKCGRATQQMRLNNVSTEKYHVMQQK